MPRLRAKATATQATVEATEGVMESSRENNKAARANRWTVTGLHARWFGPDATPPVEGLVDVTEQTGKVAPDPPLSEFDVGHIFSRLVTEHMSRSDQHTASAIAHLWAEFRHLRSIVRGGDRMTYSGSTPMSLSAKHRQALASGTFPPKPDAAT